ncbi:MAG: hypothetical protein M1541_12295, partial [Acidobacteria bacterium]|nr:hypothetical protein [Acidobacteriota bacterium]
LQPLVDNPFYPEITAGSLAQPKVQRRQLLLPYPQYTSITHQNDGSGNSTYHSMALKIEKRATQGVGFLFAYTVSKLISDVRNEQNHDGANPGYFN